jgi:hypothetical protein
MSFQVLSARYDAPLAPPAFLAKAVLTLAQFLPRSFADVIAADGGKTQLLALGVRHAQVAGEVVGGAAPLGNRRLFDHGFSLG